MSYYFNRAMVTVIFRKAIKHYTQDVYMHHQRFDSWAGMALAKSSRLESRLNVVSFCVLLIDPLSVYIYNIWL